MTVRQPFCIRISLLHLSDDLASILGRKFPSTWLWSTPPSVLLLERHLRYCPISALLAQRRLGWFYYQLYLMSSGRELTYTVILLKQEDQSKVKTHSRTSFFQVTRSSRSEWPHQQRAEYRDRCRLQLPSFHIEVSKYFGQRWHWWRKATWGNKGWFEEVSWWLRGWHNNRRLPLLVDSRSLPSRYT